MKATESPLDPRSHLVEFWVGDGNASPADGRYIVDTEDASVSRTRQHLLEPPCIMLSPCGWRFFARVCAVR